MMMLFDNFPVFLAAQMFASALVERFPGSAARVVSTGGEIASLSGAYGVIVVPAKEPKIGRRLKMMVRVYCGAFRSSLLAGGE